MITFVPFVLVGLFSGLVGSKLHTLLPALLFLCSIVIALWTIGSLNIESLLAIIFVSICLLVGYIGAPLLKDVRFVLGSVPTFNVLWYATLSVAYSLPAILLVWLILDLKEFYERQVFYGCMASVEDNHGVYGFKVGDSDEISMFAQSNGRLFVLVPIANQQTSFLPMFLTEPVNSILQKLTGSSFCPAPSEPADHEASQISTLRAISDSIEKKLLERLKAEIERAESDVADGSVGAREIIFGGDRVCSGVLPKGGHCIFGPVPRSCFGNLRWLRVPGECAQRLVLKPLVRFYEGHRAAFLQSYDLSTASAGTFGQNTTSDAVAEVERFISVELKKIEHDAVQSLLWVHFWWKLLAWLGNIAVLSILLKWFLTFFARFVFSADGGGVTFNMSAFESSMGVLAKINPEAFQPVVTRRQDDDNSTLFLLNNIDGGYRWLVFENAGVRWDKSRTDLISFRYGGSLQRMRCGKFWAHRAEASRNNGELGGNVDYDTSIGFVRLRKDQRLIVDPRHLLAFNDEIRFGTKILFRLAAFLQYRLFYLVAFSRSDNGVVLLSGGGKVIQKLAPGKDRVHVDPRLLAAHDAAAVLSCSSSLGFPSLYNKWVEVGPASSEDLVVADARGADRSVTVWEKLRRLAWFLLPI